MQSTDISIAASELKRLAEIPCLRGKWASFDDNLRCEDVADEPRETSGIAVRVPDRPDYEICVRRIEASLEELRAELRESIASLEADDGGRFDPDIRPQYLAAKKAVVARDRAWLDSLTVSVAAVA